MLLVTDWVSPRTSNVIGAVFAMVKEDPVTCVVVLPYFLEDEAVLRENLENLGRSPPAEKHMRVVLATEARKGPHSHDSRVSHCGNWFTCSRQFTKNPFGPNTVWNFTSSVFKTVGEADTPWHPQFFSAVMLEFCVGPKTVHGCPERCSNVFAMEAFKSRPLTVLSDSAQIVLHSLVFSTPPTHARLCLLVSESLLLCVSVSAEEYRNIGFYWEMFERLGSLGLRTAGVHGWLQVAAIETAVSKQTSSLPQRAISTSSLFRGSGAHVFVAECELLCPFQACFKGVVSKASCKA